MDRRLCPLAPFALLALISACALDEEVEPEGVPPRGPENLLSVQAVLDAAGCDSSDVLGLSRQIADEMACMAGAVLEEVRFDQNLVAESAAVLPFFAPQAATALRAASREHRLVLSSAFRTVAQQFLLHGWFRRGLCRISVASTPGNSNHESGRAIDVINFTEARATLEKHGWKQTVMGDPVHFDHLASPDLRGLDVHAFQRLWNRNVPNDRISEDGEYGTQTEMRLMRTPADGFLVGPCRG